MPPVEQLPAATESDAPYADLSETRLLSGGPPRAWRLASSAGRRSCWLPSLPSRSCPAVTSFPVPRPSYSCSCRWPPCGCGSRRAACVSACAALVGLSAFALFALWEGLSIAWSVGPDLSWLAFDVTLLYLVVAAVVVATPGRAGAAAAGGLRLRLRDGPGGRLRLPRESVARRGDACPSLRPPQRSGRLLERACHHARHGDRAGARGRLAPRPAGRRARRLCRRPRALPLHPVLHLLAGRHARPWRSPWWSTSRSPTSACRARSAWRWPRRPSPRPSSRRAISTRSSTPPPNDAPAHRPGTHVRARGARRALCRGRRPGRGGARHAAHRARRSRAGRRGRPGAGRRGGRRGRGRDWPSPHGTAGSAAWPTRSPHQFTSSDDERQSPVERRRPSARARQQRPHPHGPRGPQGLPAPSPGRHRRRHLPLYELSLPTERTFVVKHAHNQWINVLSELGLVGLVLFVVAVGGLLVAALRPVGRAARDADRGLLAALQAVSIAFVVHMTIDWDWDMAAADVAFLLLTGVAAAYVRGRRASLAVDTTIGSPRARTAARGGLRFGIASRVLATGVLALVAASFLLPYLSGAQPVAGDRPGRRQPHDARRSRRRTGLTASTRSPSTRCSRSPWSNSRRVGPARPRHAPARPSACSRRTTRPTTSSGSCS